MGLDKAKEFDAHRGKSLEPIEQMGQLSKSSARPVKDSRASKEKQKEQPNPRSDCFLPSHGCVIVGWGTLLDISRRKRVFNNHALKPRYVLAQQLLQFRQNRLELLRIACGNGLSAQLADSSLQSNIVSHNKCPEVLKNRIS